MNTILKLLRDNARAPGEIRAEAQGDQVDIVLKGVISSDWGVGATQLREAFAMAEGRDVRLHINSPGGDVFEGREMQSILVGHAGKVTAIVEGVAASAATILALSANETHIVKGSRYMIHNGWSITVGNRHDHMARYNLLEGFDRELAGEYAKYSGQAVDQISSWMDAETWFTADEAVSNGFAQKLIDNTKADHLANQVRQWNLSAYNNPPDLSDLLNKAPAPDYEQIRAHNERRLRLLDLNA